MLINNIIVFAVKNIVDTFKLIVNFWGLCAVDLVNVKLYHFNELGIEEKVSYDIEKNTVFYFSDSDIIRDE